MNIRNRYIQISPFVAMTCLGIILTGCAHKPKPVICCPKTLTVPQLNTPQIKHLRRSGIQIIQAGQMMTLVFPSDEVFNPDSANFNPEYRQVLECAARFIRSYDKVTVSVMGYSDDMMLGPNGRKQALTTLQAQQLKDFLWRQGINARLVYAKGKGSEDPVASNVLPYGQSVNRRVEVSFQFYPKSFIY